MPQKILEANERKYLHTLNQGKQSVAVCSHLPAVKESYSCFWGNVKTTFTLFICFLQDMNKRCEACNKLYSSLRIGWSLGGVNKLIKILSFQPNLTLVPSLSPPSSLHLYFSPEQNYKYFNTGTIIETFNAWHMQAISSLMKTTQITTLYQTKVQKAAIC